MGQRRGEAGRLRLFLPVLPLGALRTGERGSRRPTPRPSPINTSSPPFSRSGLSRDEAAPRREEPGGTVPGAAGRGRRGEGPGLGGAGAGRGGHVHRASGAAGPGPGAAAP